jgi:beta-lactamase regulating signal transducer with metallopeptidase domain
MTGIVSWVSPDVMHALGWALIHSLWQCLGIAALAAALMVLSRRPSIRYFVAVGALALMLAAPVASFFILMKSAAAARAFPPSNSGSFIFAGSEPLYAPAPPSVTASPAAVMPATMGNAVVGALENLPGASPNVLPWLVGAWLCGVAFFGLRFTGGFLLLEHRRRRHSAALNPRILAMCEELQCRLRLSSAIRYLECNWLQAPAVIGWFRPIVLLPVSALTGLSEEQLRAVIVHELAHIRRLDAFVNLFQILVEALLFYHPAAWWLNWRIRAERELCCDEIAVSLASNRVEYARALTLMAEWKDAPMLAMAANRGPLSRRILHILGRKPFGAGPRILGLSGSALFLTAALAAANALFGIAYPIPMAHAKESLKASLGVALSSGQFAIDHAVRQALQSTPTKNTLPGRTNDTSGRETTIAVAEQIEARQLDKPVAPSPDAPPISGGASTPVTAAPAETGAPTENVTVTGSRRAYHDFSRKFATPTKLTGKIARWERGICPVVVGQNPHYAAFIMQHLKYVALAAGAHVNTDASCTPNIDIVFTTTPQDLLDTVSKDDQHYLGYFSSVAQKNALATVTRPIQAWYATESTDIKGRRHLDTGRSIVGGTSVQNFNGLTGPVGDTMGTSAGSALTDMAPFFYVTGNRTSDGVHTGFYHVLIVIDSTKLAGQDIVPLADYISMLALSQINAPDACQDLPSIVNTMAPGCDHTADALTMFDLAYLQSLYHMSADRNLMMQRSEIGDLMTDRLEKLK